MPAGSRTLGDEGVVIPPTRLDDQVLADLVSRMRNPEERRGTSAHNSRRTTSPTGG